MQKNSKPISLDELEVMFLAEQTLQRRRKIIVDEGSNSKKQYKMIDQARDKRYIRSITIFTIIFLALLLLVPIFFPDRYTMVKEIISIFLAGISGFAMGKFKIFQVG